MDKNNLPGMVQTLLMLKQKVLFTNGFMTLLCLRVCLQLHHIVLFCGKDFKSQLRLSIPRCLVDVSKRCVVKHINDLCALCNKKRLGVTPCNFIGKTIMELAKRVQRGI